MILKVSSSNNILENFVIIGNLMTLIDLLILLFCNNELLCFYQIKEIVTSFNCIYQASFNALINLIRV